jgi:uncharacterized membrane protein YphA (DoxX/SURF4 family)
MSPVPGRGLTIAHWIARVLLCLFFAMAGFVHGLLPVDQVAKSAPWAADVPVALLRFIGACELAGAVGLLVPRLMRLAALGLMTIMVLAAIFHVSRGESRMIPVNLSVAAVAAFVAWKTTSGAVLRTT